MVVAGIVLRESPRLFQPSISRNTSAYRTIAQQLLRISVLFCDMFRVVLGMVELSGSVLRMTVLSQTGCGSRTTELLHKPVDKKMADR